MFTVISQRIGNFFLYRTVYMASFWKIREAKQNDYTEEKSINKSNFPAVFCLRIDQESRLPFFFVLYSKRG